MISCSDSEEVLKPDIIASNGEVLIQPIQKLENPYSVSNMRKAYAALQQENALRCGSEIEATHLYVRFLPKDSMEYELLCNDTTLTLFGYPLDYELTEGDTYVDSTLLDQNYTWFYTRVPVGYASPIEGYEVLDELYLPLTDVSVQGASGQRRSVISESFWEKLENKSLELTGNEPSNAAMLRSSKWTPEVTIKLEGTPLEGVKVRARRWFNWESAITNSEGFARMPDNFSGKVNYSIIWERDDWDIISDRAGQAEYDGPHQKSNWTLNIQECKSRRTAVYATIHRACMVYWFKNEKYGIRKPFHDTFWTHKVKIHAFNKDGTSRAYAKNKIRIFGKHFGAMLCGEYIFQTTIHELAHISHDNMIGNVIDDVQLIVGESWAVGVEYYVSRDYVGYGSLVDGDWQGYTLGTLRTDKKKKYTPIVIDLIDTYNQGSKSSLYPIDRVSGYTLAQIETSLNGVKTLEQWRDNLKKLYDGSSEQYLDEFFEQYIHL